MAAPIRGGAARGPAPRENTDILAAIPDVRDGLTRDERIVLYVLHNTQQERGGRNVPTVMLWGRVCEHFYISPEDLSAMLARLGAQKTKEGNQSSEIKPAKLS